jgi:hypothetical protein
MFHVYDVKSSSWWRLMLCWCGTGMYFWRTGSIARNTHFQRHWLVLLFFHMTTSLHIFYLFYLPLFSLPTNSSFSHAPFSDPSKIPLSLDIQFSREFQLINLRRLEWAGHVLTRERRDVRMFFVRKYEGKRLLGRPRHRWRITIKMFLQELRLEDVDWINLAHKNNRRRAVVNVVIELRVP